MALTQQEIDAFNQVKTTIDALQAEYAAVCAGIAATEKQLAELPLLPVPVADLKAAILDFVDVRGQDYLADSVKSSIKDFATNSMNGTSVNANPMGSPLRFKELESACAGNNGAISNAQLITQFGKGQFNDLALYAFFGDLVKAGLTNVMATMTDADFGYNKLTPGQIGTDRATRRAAIQAAQDQLSTLRANKAALADSLRQLGVTVKA
jgi:hypothetical protein